MGRRWKELAISLVIRMILHHEWSSAHEADVTSAPRQDRVDEALIQDRSLVERRWRPLYRESIDEVACRALHAWRILW